MCASCFRVQETKHTIRQYLCTERSNIVVHKNTNYITQRCYSLFWMRRGVALQMGTNVSKEPAAVIIRAEELLRYLISQQNIGAVRRKKIRLSKCVYVK